MERKEFREQNTVSPNVELDGFEEGSDEEDSGSEEVLGLGEIPVKVRVKKEKDFVRK